MAIVNGFYSLEAGISYTNEIRKAKDELESL